MSKDSAFPQLESLLTQSYGGVGGIGGPALVEAQSTGGLTKRELLAAMAMQGTLSGSPGWNDPSDADRIAKISVAFADALLKKLAESK